LKWAAEALEVPNNINPQEFNSCENQLDLKLPNAEQ
jgi:hypothetical protein